MFKCQPGYTLRKIKGINYLLPYGQQIADLKKGFVLNETSTFLWNVLQHHEGAEPQQLAEILARTYQLDESYYPELLKDVTDFLTQLTAMGMITEDLHLISDNELDFNQVWHDYIMLSAIFIKSNLKCQFFVSISLCSQIIFSISQFFK